MGTMEDMRTALNTTFNILGTTKRALKTTSSSAARILLQHLCLRQQQLHHALAIKVGMFLATTATSIAPTKRAGTKQRSTARKRVVTWPLSTHLPFKNM